MMTSDILTLRFELIKHLLLLERYQSASTIEIINIAKDYENYIMGLNPPNINDFSMESSNLQHDYDNYKTHYSEYEL